MSKEKFTPKREETEAERTLREKYGWRKVVSPRSWRPQDPGEELIGYYGGRTLRNVRIIFRGEEQFKNSHMMRHFDLLVAEGDSIPEEDMPAIRN